MKKVILSLLAVFLVGLTYGQELETDDTDIILDNLLDIDDQDLYDLIGDLDKYHFLLIAADFNSKAYFLGRDLGLDQVGFAPQIMYQNHLGIYLGVSGAVYGDFDPKWDLTTLTAGYGKDFGEHENFRAELGYSRYIFSQQVSNDFENSLDLGLYASTKENTLGSSLKGAYLFGDRTGFQTTLSVFGTLKIANLDTNRGTVLNFEPVLDLVFASENIDTSRIDNLGLDIPFINNVVDSFETFSLRNTQLRLPLVFDFGALNLETGINFNFPSAFDFERELDNSTFFNFGASYLFDL